jgi:hypothetical protein
VSRAAARAAGAWIAAAMVAWLFAQASMGVVSVLHVVGFARPAWLAWFVAQSTLLGWTLRRAARRLPGCDGLTVGVLAAEWIVNAALLWDNPVQIDWSTPVAHPLSVVGALIAWRLEPRAPAGDA